MFPKGKQKKFLESSKKELGLTWPEFSKELNVNRTTLEKSYRREYCSLPYTVFRKTCKLKKEFPSGVIEIYKAKVVSFDPHTVIGRKVLGESRTKIQNIKIKYPKNNLLLPSLRTKYSFTDKKRKLRFPREMTPLLAEEIGIHYGDGFLSDKRKEFRVKGNKNDEKEYYDRFITELYKTLFNLDIKLKEYETTYGFEVSSTALWDFKTKVLNIKAGKKDKISFPEVIKVNNIDILTSFLRGLFDTDGSVSFISKYGYQSYYPLISLTLKSEKVIKETNNILQMLGFNPKCYSTGRYSSINLNGYKRLALYSKLVGWNNPKHLNKVKEWKQKYPEIGMAVVV